MASMSTPETSTSPTLRDMEITRAARPRTIRPNSRAILSRLVMGILAVCVAAIMRSLLENCLATRSISDFLASQWYAVIGLLILAFVEFSALWSAARTRHLLKNGEVAIAAVLTQKRILAPRSAVSRLTYTFEDNHGSRHRGSCTDETGTLSQGMCFLVYFERDLPQRRVESCCSDFEIVLPNEQ